MPICTARHERYKLQIDRSWQRAAANSICDQGMFFKAAVWLGAVRASFFLHLASQAQAPLGYVVKAPHSYMKPATAWTQRYRD